MQWLIFNAWAPFECISQLGMSVFYMLVCEHQCEIVHYNGAKNRPKQLFSSNIVVCVQRFSKYSFPIVMPYIIFISLVRRAGGNCKPQTHESKENLKKQKHTHKSILAKGWRFFAGKYEHTSFNWGKTSQQSHKQMLQFTVQYDPCKLSQHFIRIIF